MPEFERDTRQLALLEAYERALLVAPDAPPPHDLDPALAATARALTQQLGAPPAGQTAAPTAAFRAALRQRLTEQAASYPAVPARTAPPSVAATNRHLPAPSGHERRRASFRPRGTEPVAPQRTDATDDAPAIPARPQAVDGTATPRRRPLRTAISNSVGWLGAALVIAIVILAATLLLRGLPRSTPATQPTLPPPSAVPAPSTTAAPVPTATTAQPTAPAATTATPRPVAPLWQPTGTLALPRAQHSATRLADGRVLVAGGNIPSGEGITATTELYDPQTGRWSPTGDMGLPRSTHRAILLADGRVLAIGGFNYRQFNNTTKAEGAELYDPATGGWTPTTPPPLNFTPRALTLLSDGRVFAASGPDGTAGNKTTALVYDPASNLWTVVGNLDLPDIGAAIALRDGSVLLIGEVAADNDGTTPALLLNPATGATTPAPLPDARSGFSAAILPDGGVLVAGGLGWGAQTDGQPTPLASALRFDPQTAIWAETATMIAPRNSVSAVALADGRVLVVGNADGSQDAATAELYSPQTRTWTNLGATGGRARARFALAPLADGRALVIGGDAGFVRSEYLSEVQLLTPLSGAGATTRTGSGAATPGPSSGIADWTSPSAGLLFHNGRGYRLGGPTLPDGSAPQVAAQVGSTLLRWQSGGVFPANTPIYAVQGQPAEEWLVLRDGVRVILYRQDDDTTALLAGIQVIEGRVLGDGTTVCPGYGCPASPPTAQQGTVATANRVRVERALQGSITPGAEIEVRQMGVPVAEDETARIATLRPGERVLLFLQLAQGQSIGDFGTGDYYWTGLGWTYGFVGETVVPLGGSGGVQTPLDRFEAAIREIFAPVTPRAPTDPVPTPRPIPTATGVVPQPTAPLPIPNAPPTPTPGP